MTQILIITALIAGLIFGLAWFNDSQAAKIKAEAQAQATVIQANAQASATMTQANAALMIAAFPVAVAVFGGAAVMLCAGALLIFAIRWRPRRVIEQRVVFEIGSGVPRREVWQALTAQSELLEARRDVTKTIIPTR